MAGQAYTRIAVAGMMALALAGCQTGGVGGAAEGTAAGASTSASGTARSTKLVDRDVEAPNVFNVTDSALWDGRPSLGGVWVASEKAVDPERVILRNPANGKFVIGALFKREAFNPGPPLQISSDAAAALGLVAGQPATISVTALRREEVPVEAPDATRPILDANQSVQTAALPAAAAAIERAEVAARPGATPTAAPTAPAGAAAIATAPIAAAPLPAAPAAPGAKPAAPAVAAAAPVPTSPVAPVAAGGNRAQIGIFSIEANAQRAVDQLKKAGIAATIRKGEAKGKAYWSVTASGDGAGKAFLDKVKSLGFSDAYLLSR